MNFLSFFLNCGTCWVNASADTQKIHSYPDCVNQGILSS